MRHLLSDYGGKNFNVAHDFFKLRRIQRLRRVRKRVFGVRVNFHDDSVRARRHSRQRHRRNFVANAKSVAWVNDYWKMRHASQNWNRAQIKRVSRGVFKRANSAFAQNHVVRSARKQIFRAHQPFFDCCRNSAF